MPHLKGPGISFPGWVGWLCDVGAPLTGGCWQRGQGGGTEDASAAREAPPGQLAAYGVRREDGDEFLGVAKMASTG